MASPYINFGTDGFDLGYHKGNLDAQMVIARDTGDRRTATRTLYTGGFFYNNASGQSILRASYPRTWLDVDTWTLSGKTVRTANSDATFQSALTAAGGSATPSVIVVDHTVVYTATYILPQRDGDQTPGGSNNNIVVIISKAIYDSMIANGGVSTVVPAKVRATLNDMMNFMPFMKNTSLANAEQWAINAGSNGFRFVGIRWGLDPAVSIMGRLIRAGNGDDSIQSAASQCPRNIIFDRCGFDGNAICDLKAAAEMHSINQACIDSYFGDNIHHTGNDCKAINWYNSPGPTCVMNNRLVASTEAFMAGGAYTACGLPSDLEFRWNFLDKPLTWDSAHPTYAGVAYQIKNAFEIKACQYALVEGNYVRHTWPAGQTGAAFLVKAESYGNGAVFGYTNNVLVRWNMAEQISMALNVAGVANVDPANAVVNMCSTGNLYVQGGTYYNATDNPFFGIGLVNNVGSIHDTFINASGAAGGVLNYCAPASGSGVYCIDSIVDWNTWGVKASGATDGTNSLNLIWGSTWDFRKSVFIGKAGQNYPPTCVTTSDQTPVQFTNYATGQYDLLGSTQGGGTVVTPPANILMAHAAVRLAR